MLFYSCAVLMSRACFSGAGRERFPVGHGLQLLAIPVLLAALWRAEGSGQSRQGRGALLFCLAIVLVPALQLVPLPPQVWTALPHREPSVAAFDLLGLERTVDADQRHRRRRRGLAFSRCCRRLAVFLATAELNLRDRAPLEPHHLRCWRYRVIVGLTQVAQGPASPLRLFEFTNTTEAVGFFANAITSRRFSMR